MTFEVVATKQQAAQLTNILRQLNTGGTMKGLKALIADNQLDDDFLLEEVRFRGKSQSINGNDIPNNTVEIRLNHSGWNFENRRQEEEHIQKVTKLVEDAFHAKLLSLWKMLSKLHFLGIIDSAYFVVGESSPFAKAFFVRVVTKDLKDDRNIFVDPQTGQLHGVTIK